MKIWLLVGLGSLCLLGCNRSETTSPGAPASATQEQTTASSVIDDLTGKTTIDAGRRAAKTIRRVSDQENKNYKDVQDE